MNSWGNSFKKFSFFFLAGAVIFTSMACEPLRKKFVRQKKKDQKEEFVPVLDPIDYPAAIFSPENNYKKAYGLWKIWNKEYSQEIEINENDKREVYLLNEVISQLEEMKKLVREDKQSQLVQVINQMNLLREDYKTSAIMRRASAMKRTVEQNAKIVFNELNPTIMKDSLIAP